MLRRLCWTEMYEIYSNAATFRHACFLILCKHRLRFVPWLLYVHNTAKYIFTEQNPGNSIVCGGKLSLFDLTIHRWKHLQFHKSKKWDLVSPNSKLWLHPASATWYDLSPNHKVTPLSQLFQTVTICVLYLLHACILMAFVFYWRTRQHQSLGGWMHWGYDIQKCHTLDSNLWFVSWPTSHQNIVLHVCWP